MFETNPLSVNVSGVEDKPIALAIKAALGEVDADAVLSVTISGIPAGVTLSAGSLNADGSVTLTPAQLAGLTLTGDGEAGAGRLKSFDLTVTATAVDGGDTATSASVSETFHVSVAPVADTPNNWVQVQKSGEGKYVAEVGKETFEVEIKVSLVNGKMLSARMDNPVEVLKRECADSALVTCGAVTRYQIRRQIEVQ